MLVKVQVQAYYLCTILRGVAASIRFKGVEGTFRGVEEKLGVWK